MNKLKELFMTFLSRWSEPLSFFLYGSILWYVLSRFMEPSMAAVGPEFFVRLGVKLVLLAMVLVFTRMIVKWQYPSIFDFTDTEGGAKKSQFRAAWDEAPPVVKVCISVAVFLGVGIIVALLLNGGY